MHAASPRLQALRMALQLRTSLCSCRAIRGGCRALQASQKPVFRHYSVPWRCCTFYGLQLEAHHAGLPCESVPGGCRRAQVSGTGRRSWRVFSGSCTHQRPGGRSWLGTTRRARMATMATRLSCWKHWSPYCRWTSAYSAPKLLSLSHFQHYSLICIHTILP